MSRTRSTMETPTPSSSLVRESKSWNRVASCKLLFSGLLDVCDMPESVESSSGYSLVKHFQFELTFALMELVATMSALCDIGVEIPRFKLPYGLYVYSVDDRSGCVPYNLQGLSATGESLHDSDTEWTNRSRDADQSFHGYPLARIGGVAAVW